MTMNGRAGIDRKALGVTGLKQQGGIVREEWLPDLTGERGRRTIRRMVDGDPLIGGILLAIELLIRQVEWTIVPASEEPADVEAAAFIQECWDALDPSWTESLSELLSFLPWGWVLLEIVYTQRPDGRTGWEGFGIRSQDTLGRWVFGDNGAATAMVQIDPQTYQERPPIPMGKAIHITTTSRKGNPEGRTILRNVYRPWYFKGRIENIEGVGIERDLAGLPVAWVPPELLAPDASEADQTVLSEIKKIVVNIRRDEQEGVIFPLEYDENGHKTYDLSLLSTGGRRQFDTSGIISRYEARMAMALLADFILLGHEKVGSFALSSDKTELFSVALGAWLDSICEAINKQAFERLLALNGITAVAPNLMHGDVETADLGVLGTFLKDLKTAGATLFPNDLLLAHVLKQAGLPVVTQAITEAPEPDDEEEGDAASAAGDEDQGGAE